MVLFSKRSVPELQLGIKMAERNPDTDSPEMETFLSMQKTISGHITNSLDALCADAIEKRLMTYAEMGKILEGSSQCIRFLNHFGMKIEVTPGVFYQFVELLGALRTCDGVVQQINDTLALNKKEEEKKDPVDLPDTPQEHFPHLPTKNLNDNEIGDLRARLIEDCRKLDRDFTSLVHKTLEFLERKNIPVRELRDLVKTSRFLKSLLDLFKEGLEVRRLFVDKLDDYWSFFDYDLIELFVRHFGDAPLKDLMDKYLTAFDQYCQRRLHEVPNIKTESGMKGYILHVKIPQKFHATTVNDIKAVQIQLQKLFGQKLYMVGTQDSCVLLVFVSFINILSLTIEQVHQLHDMGVLNVSTQYCVLYDHGDDKNIGKLRSSTVMVIEPCDVINGRIQPRWHEWSGMKWSGKKWTKAELYLTPLLLCYKIEGIEACKINLEDLEQIDVCHGMMILIKTEMAAEMVVRCIVPILICGSDDDKQQLAATEWKNAVVNQIEKIKPVWETPTFRTPDPEAAATTQSWPFPGSLLPPPLPSPPLPWLGTPHALGTPQAGSTSAAATQSWPLPRSLLSQLPPQYTSPFELGTPPTKYFHALSEEFGELQLSDLDTAVTAHQEQETGRQERAYKRTASTQELREFWSLKETSSRKRARTQEFSERLKETADKDTEKQEEHFNVHKKETNPK